MRRWNLPQVNTKVMCAVLTAAMVMTEFTACGGTTSAGTESTASESAEQKETIAPEGTTEQSTVEQSTETESGEEKVESYLGQITAIDGNVAIARCDDLCDPAECVASGSDAGTVTAAKPGCIGIQVMQGDRYGSVGGDVGGASRFVCASADY